MIEIAGGRAAEGDPRLHPPVGQVLAHREFDDGAFGEVESELWTPEADPSQVVTTPNALGGDVFGG